MEIYLIFLYRVLFLTGGIYLVVHGHPFMGFFLILCAGSTVNISCK